MKIYTRLLLAFVLLLQSAFASYPGETPTFSEVTATTTMNVQGDLTKTVSSDSTTTGASAEMANPSTPIVRLTNGSLVSLATIANPHAGQEIIIMNGTGDDITILNETGTTAANRILLGTNTHQTLKNQSTMTVFYDTVNSRWRNKGISNKLLTPQSKTSAYTILTSDDIIFANAVGGAFTLTLPSAVNLTGKVIRIVKTDSTFNAVTIDGNGAETISGPSGASATTTLNTIGEITDIMSINSNWIIINRVIPSGWVSHTPSDSTFDAFTTSARAFRWRRSGDSIEIEINLTLSSAVSATLEINTSEYLPPGLSFDNSRQTMIMGTARALDASAGTAADDFLGVTYSLSTGTIRIMSKGTDVFDATEPFTWASGDFLLVRLQSVPITGWKE